MLDVSRKWGRSWWSSFLWHLLNIYKRWRGFHVSIYFINKFENTSQYIYSLPFNKMNCVWVDCHFSLNLSSKISFWGVGQCMRGNVWGAMYEDLLCFVWFLKQTCRIPSLGKIFNAEKAWKILTLSIQGVSKSVTGWFFNDSLKNVSFQWNILN